MPAHVGRLAVPLFSAFAALLLLGASPESEGPSAPAPAPSATAASVAIYDVTVSPDPVKASKIASVTVHTTPNVISIGIKVVGHTFTVPKTGEGLFYGAGKVPWFAHFFHGTFTVTFVATGPNGATAEMNTIVRM
jgi:hypothetical protein